MRLDLGIIAGDESKRFLSGLAATVDKFTDAVARLEKAQGNKTAAPAVDEDEDEEEEETSAIDMADVKKKAKKTKATTLEELDDDDYEEDTKTTASDDDEDDTDATYDKETMGEDDDEDDTDSEDDEAEAPAKKTRTKKLTTDDVIDAAKVYARSIGGTKGKDAVLAILKKKFGVKSTSALKTNQLEAAIKALRVRN